MKLFSAKDIRNVAVLGHGSSGKTSVSEALLYLSGGSDRLGKVSEGNTVFDFDPEEKRRHTSVSASVAPAIWNNTKINIIDAPGLFDFAGGVSEALRAADSALIVLSGKSGFTVGAEKSFKALRAAGKGYMFFVSKLDSDNADFYKVYNALSAGVGSSLCPVVIPCKANGSNVYISLVTGKAYTFKDGKGTETEKPDFPEYEQMYDKFCEAVAGVDEDLMDKYFSGEEFTEEELLSGLAKGTASGDLHPVLCGTGLSMEGITLLLDGIKDIMPSAEIAAETAEDAKGNKIELAVDESAPAAAIVFKTIADPFVGKLSYFKVISGKISPESSLLCDMDGSPLRIGKVVVLKGGKQEEAACIPAGDIGAVAKLNEVKTGSTLSDSARPVKLKGLDFPAPCLSMAVRATGKGEEEKVAAGIIRLLEEDPTIKYENNSETRQQVLSGLGEQHLDVIVSKLKAKFGVEVTLHTPKVPYRETIRKSVKVQGKHKKQSGGHGQYGDVWIEFGPCDSDSLVFEEKVFGGAVPRNFFPAVEKGLQESISKGILAGYPVVGLKATLYDGSYHAVDSSEMSFKLAASMAYKNGLPQASPVLLEPIGQLKALVPDDNMGDVIGDINKRRGRVLGMNPGEESYQEIVADVPMAEMGDFSTFLRSCTQGRGSFSFEFERYEDAPPNVAQKVIEAAKAEEN